MPDPAPRRNPFSLGRRPGWERRRGFGLGQIVSLVILLVFSIPFLAPLVWAVSGSLQTPADALSVPPQWIPRDPTGDNYTRVFEQIPFTQYLFNSVVVTGGIMLGHIVTCTMAGYAFGRLEFFGRRTWFAFLLATMMVPGTVTIVPVFLLVSRLGLVDSLAGLIVPALATAFGTFLMAQYFAQIPQSLDDAAMLDGANPFQVFVLIHLRLVRSGIIVVALLGYALYWNEFFRPLIFLTSGSNLTLPVGLVALRGNQGSGSFTVVLAGVVLSMLPSLVVFVFGQRHLARGIVSSSDGLKG